MKNQNLALDGGLPYDAVKQELNVGKIGKRTINLYFVESNVDVRPLATSITKRMLRDIKDNPGMTLEQIVAMKAAACYQL